MRYALINKGNGKIENIIIWDGLTPIDLASNIQVEVCTPEHESAWSMQNIEKYGGIDSPLGLS